MFDKTYVSKLQSLLDPNLGKIKNCGMRAGGAALCDLGLMGLLLVLLSDFMEVPQPPCSELK